MFQKGNMFTPSFNTLKEQACFGSEEKVRETAPKLLVIPRGDQTLHPQPIPNPCPHSLVCPQNTETLGWRLLSCRWRLKDTEEVGDPTGWRQSCK